MKLVIFDIDGTLTESNDLDDEAFIKALDDVFGFKAVSNDWESYTHVTNSCVLEEVYQLRQGHRPSSKEVNYFRNRFLELISEVASAHGGVQPIRGASSVLTRLLTSPDYAVAYAGGDWRDSALFKLRAAGLPTENIPHAFSDDDRSREGICKLALVRAEAHYRYPFREIFYIGDGVWDIRCAQRLGYPFIGIGQGEGARKLIAEGARHVLPDYQDVDGFLSLLELRELT
ncbi:MAG: HAD family hydrolase [Chloroflexota bacterium]|nr:MAG: HAD family hydrolase [Chloroflexota bacterium]